MENRMNDEGSEPPVYEEVVSQSKKDSPGCDNRGFTCDESEIHVEVDIMEINQELNTKDRSDQKPEKVNLTEQEEERMLSCLRRISQSCTNANVLKRPSALELAKMLEESCPGKLLEEWNSD